MVLVITIYTVHEYLLTETITKFVSDLRFNNYNEALIAAREQVIMILINMGTINLELCCF